MEAMVALGADRINSEGHQLTANHWLTQPRIMRSITPTLTHMRRPGTGTRMEASRETERAGYPPATNVTLSNPDNTENPTEKGPCTTDSDR